jgi:glycosyltransferase involved in cell wall biosynthesis
MKQRRALNLFYEEPDPDRWAPFDRYPRRLIRRLVRGPDQPGGAMRVFLNLMAGLDHIEAAYRVNDYEHIRANPDELACVIGKPQVLDKIPSRTPILFGTSIYSHPNDDPDLPKRRPIRQVLVPSPWVRDMFAELWPGQVSVWPVGIDTDRWSIDPAASRDIDVLIYDKIFWQRDLHMRTLIEPLYAELSRRRLQVKVLRYGSYREEELFRLSRRVRSMVFLSRHETQGIAAQQMMASGVPLFAWDKGGLWQDPKYAPHQVRFGPVSSVPYWDERCGAKFADGDDLPAAFDIFWRGVEAGSYAPRQMLLEHFTLEKRARAYLELADKYGAAEN